MKINYKLTEQDYIEFNLNHMKYSKAIKRSLFIQRYSSVIVFMSMPFILIRVTAIPLWYWVLGFSITTILWIYFYPKHAEKCAAKRMFESEEQCKEFLAILNKNIANTI
jgi:hypothetical protein